MFDARQSDRHEAYYGHLVSLESKRFPRWSNSPYFDVSVSVWRTGGLVAHEQEQPDEDNGDDRYRQCNIEPASPIKLGIHESGCNKISRRRDGRSLVANVGGEYNSELCIRHISSDVNMTQPCSQELSGGYDVHDTVNGSLSPIDDCRHVAFRDAASWSHWKIQMRDDVDRVPASIAGCIWLG